LRDIVTTLLEVTGMTGLALAAGLQVAVWSVPGGIATGSAVLIGAATLIERPWTAPAAVTVVEPPTAPAAVRE
jgi:hypothetical protein